MIETKLLFLFFIAKLGLNLSEKKRAFSNVAPPSNVNDGSSERNSRVLPSRLPASASTSSSSEKAANSASNETANNSIAGGFTSPKRPKLSKNDATNQKEHKKKSRKIESPTIDVVNNADDAEDDLEEEYEEEEWDRHRALHNDVSARRVVDNIEDMNDQLGKCSENHYFGKNQCTLLQGG